ncbi:hypothetical protein EIP91_011404 [Steccherinum ochraceum]|uniref:Chromo domain-containing protein n=1 Tax=Steccherinum ochraceum TaxID=92696 RepID=A0A4R0RBF3_9APHY|nr:hypothetical protein EIP91_011404 [Steccherinum ochraceum]
MSEGTLQLYEIEVILEARLKSVKTDTEDAVWEYFVKWAGYNNRYNSWRDVSAMGKDCNRLIRSFWNEVGPPEPSLEVNHTVRPSAEWIAREKMRYAKHFSGDGGATVVAEKDFQRSNMTPPQPEA